MDNFEHCTALVREADRDRYLATLFAPAEHRDALFALYAFNAEIARVREVAREPLPGEIRLQWWREVLSGERDGEAAAHPVAAALHQTLLRYQLPSEPLLDLIEAHSFDLYNDPMGSIAELDSYGDRTAGAIVELAARVLVEEPNQFILDGAKYAGKALTLAHVLAKFPLHAARAQLYMPLEYFELCNAKYEDVFARRVTEELRKVCKTIAERGRGYLLGVTAKGDKMPKSVWPAFLPLAAIRPTFMQTWRSSYDPFDPTAITAMRRQWRIWRAAKDLRAIIR